MSSLNPIFAYFAPETLLPVTSIIATVIGAVLMFGRKSFVMLFRVCRYALVRLQRAEQVDAIKGPHFRQRDQRHARVSSEVEPSHGDR